MGHFPWFSHDFPMIFPWFSHDFPIRFSTLGRSRRDPKASQRREMGRGLTSDSDKWFPWDSRWSLVIHIHIISYYFIFILFHIHIISYSYYFIFILFHIHIISYYFILFHIHIISYSYSSFRWYIYIYMDFLLGLSWGYLLDYMEIILGYHIVHTWHHGYFLWDDIFHQWGYIVNNGNMEIWRV